jgi:hypothetical protein
MKLVQELDIPDSYYEKAVNRYKSLGSWLERPQSRVRQFGPKIYPQGSFRLGTVNRPLLENEEYDLDLVCQLCSLSKDLISQHDLKELVGGEIKAYAKAHGIKAPVTEGKRAWRLDYADDVSFHIDILASLSEDPLTVVGIIVDGVSYDYAQHAIALTCRTDPNYNYITNDWPTSNPSGYGMWFEERMAVVAKARREALMREGLFASVEEVPVYRLKTPLQRSVQILKRHRDVMFQNDPELKPISMLITTLAAHAYSGEMGLYDGLISILGGMLRFIQQESPRVPNPVNMGEDFANKWSTDSRLERNFRAWHAQACLDIQAILEEGDPGQLGRLGARSFSLGLSSGVLLEMTGLSGSQAVSVSNSPLIKASPARCLRVPNSSPSPWGGFRSED